MSIVPTKLLDVSKNSSPREKLVLELRCLNPTSYGIALLKSEQSEVDIEAIFCEVNTIQMCLTLNFSVIFLRSEIKYRDNSSVNVPALVA